MKKMKTNSDGIKLGKPVFDEMKPESPHTPTFKEIMTRIALQGQTHEDVELLKLRFNAHEELVEALKSALEYIQYQENLWQNTHALCLPDRNLEPSIKQALAKAEGK